MTGPGLKEVTCNTATSDSLCNQCKPAGEIRFINFQYHAQFKLLNRVSKIKKYPVKDSHLTRDCGF